MQGRALMSPYLPRNGSSGSPFSEGGALFALGLIHANHGQDIRSFLLESLGNTSHEVSLLPAQARPFPSLRVIPKEEQQALGMSEMHCYIACSFS